MTESIEELEERHERHKSAVCDAAQRLAERLIGGVVPRQSDDPDACGFAIAVNTIRRKREQVQRRQSGERGPDLVFRGLDTVFKVLFNVSRNKSLFGISRLEAGTGSGLRIELQTVAGAFRIRTYESSGDFARDVMSLADGADLRAAGVYSHFIQPGGHVLFTSRCHAVSLNAQNLLQCSSCGLFMNGMRGLRDHQQVSHGQSYENSTFLAKSAELPLVQSHAEDSDSVSELGCKTVWLREAWRYGLAKREQSPAKVVAMGACDAQEQQLTAAAIQAAKDGDLASLSRLVEKGWDPSKPSSVDLSGNSALEWAAGSGHVQVIRFLRESCGCDAGQPSSHSNGLARTPLHWAARKGCINVVAYLLDECGADIDARMSDDSTPFHYAVYGASQEACDLLASRGADVHAINKHGCNALQWAALTGSARMVDYLIKRHGLRFVKSKNGLSLMHKAAQRGHSELALFLAESFPEFREDWLSCDNDGLTASDVARINGHQGLSQELSKLSNKTA